ncbi:MAG: carbohydrate kinase [Bacteroidetes bacterium]|nr:MAG: carbohydrate kinase [Bacteroidota bacterium]
MQTTTVILIFDIGKTNKKLLLFDENYKIVFEESKQFAEVKDEDDYPCENVEELTKWLKESFDAICSDKRFTIKAVNFSGYGASFVYLDKEEKQILPLYNYLKPYSKELQQQFYKKYGGESLVAKQTASPVLGNLNSGMQLYRLKYEKPGEFAKIKYALHLPQYLSYVICGELNTDITSVGCHTNLWHFQHNKYHSWAKSEGVEEKFPALKDCTEMAGAAGDISVGAGLHDSSAALIPYLSSFNEPFILLSTGTWCISLNPFNHSLLSDYELHQDCLCYLSYHGSPVKASRLFAGYEHEQQTKRLGEHFKTDTGYYKKVKADLDLLKKFKIKPASSQSVKDSAMVSQSKFEKRDLNSFSNYEEAYHRLIADIMEQQVRSTNIVLRGTTVKRIFVDGGFSQNPIYMHLLSEAFPDIEVYAASVPQASALGAAMAVHPHWNNKQLPSDIIDLKLYSVAHNTTI